jgi:hypothetical protein
MTSGIQANLPYNIATTEFSYGSAIDTVYIDPVYGATSRGWNTLNLNPNAYYEYRIAPAEGASLNLNQLRLDISLGRGEMRTAVNYSTDGFRTEGIPIGKPVFFTTTTPRTLTLSPDIKVSYPDTLSIRVYAWSARDIQVVFNNRNVSIQAVASGPQLLAKTADTTASGQSPIVTENRPEVVVAEKKPVEIPSETPVQYPVVQDETIAAMAVVPQQDTLAGMENGMMAPMGSQVYYISGSFTVPAGVTCLKVEAWGAGGGGSSIQQNNREGGGGGGGAYACGIVTVTPGSTYVVSVGSGGAANINGGYSSFLTILAAGGRGGVNNSTTPGIGGPTALSTGTVLHGGGNGAVGSGTSGGGGGGAGSAGPGGNASGGTAGAGTALNGGNGGAGVSGNTNGNSGNTYGGGGSGASKTNVSNTTGGSGASGLVILTYVNSLYTITPGGSFCFGSPVTIGLSGSETGIHYQLYRDGTAVGSLVQGTGSPITFGNQTIAGVYTVQGVISVSSTSCTRPMTGTVVINVLPTITLGSNPSVCQGVTTANLPYTATSGSPNQYSIDYDAAANAAGFTDITNSALTASPIVLVVPAAAPAGTYQGNLTVRNSSTGCVSAVYPISIIINAVPVAPTAAISDRNNFCTDDPGNISLSVTGGSGTTVRWFTGSCGGTSIGTGNPLVIASPTVTTTYYARWETPTCGSSTCASVTVSILPPPVTPGTITGIIAQCPSLSGQIYSIAAVPNASTYTWSVPTGWAITAGNGTTSITVTTGAAGQNGNITVTAGNICGTSAASTLAVTVNPGTPATPGTISGTTPQCPALSGQIYSIAAVPNATTYTWSVPSGWSITGGAGTSSITVTTGNAGQNGNITVTAGNSCGTSAASTLAVTVNPGTPATPGTISGTTMYCSQQTGQIYSVVAVPDATTYNWTVPTGWSITSGAGTNAITITTGTTGQNGNITVSAGNSCGTSGTSSLAVTVETVPSQTGPINPVLTTVCQNGTYTFTVAPAPPSGVSYTWSVPSDWSITSGQGTNSVTVLVGIQSGNITLTPSNICGNGPATTLSVTVTLLPSSQGEITGDILFCEGTTHTYSVEGEGGITYLWSVPAGWVIDSGQGTKSIVTTAWVNSGVVQVIPQNSCGNGPSSSLNVTVNPLPAAETGPDGAICVGASIQIGAPAVPGNLYSWTSNPAGFTSGISNPVVAPDENTTYTLVETNPATGCSNSHSVFILARQDILITVTPTEQTICSGEVTNIQIWSNISGAIATWEASLFSGSGTTGFAGGMGYLIDQTITNTSGLPSQVLYDITVEGDGDCRNNATAVVTINPRTIPTITGPSTVCENSTGNVYLTQTGMSDYQWNIVGGTITSGSGTNTVTVTWNTPGNQSINVTYTNSYGCTDNSGNYPVTVNPVPVATALPASQGAVCPGSPITPIEITSIVSGTTYAWTRDNTVVLTGIPGSGTSNPVSGSLNSTLPATLQTTIFTIVATANGCTYSTNAEVTVGDVTPPTITCQPSPQNRFANTGGCNYTVVVAELDPVSYDDNCPGSTIRNNFNNLSTLAGAVLPQGTTNITWTVTAANLQTASCVLTVNISDNQAPVIIDCPADFTVYTGPGRTTCDQVATWTEPTASDNCGGAVTWTRSHAPGSVFPVGNTTVTYIATDASGNTATCSFVVTVIDDTPPTFTQPANITIYVDPSCNYNAGIAITGDVSNEFDNCTPTGLQAVHTDQAFVPGICAGTGTITRVWSLTDIHGNTTTHNQIITVADNRRPAIVIPANITIQCNQSSLPANTGQATATDNCGGSVTITYTDNTVQGTCVSASVITRTWTATDCSGNVSGGNQIINIIDNIPPVASVTNVTVACPADIPPRNINAVTASDNCGSVAVVYLDEVPYGLENQPGYCPYRVDRTYRVTDQCGNYTDVTQVITISSTCGCSPCATSNSFYIVDLNGQPSGSITYNNVGREDKCCDATKEDCVSFNVRIDDDAVGVQITIDGATPSPQDWRIDCENVSIIGNIVCIPGGQFYLFTYCKPGGNTNNFTFTSIPGIVATAEITTRVDCNTQITIENSNVTNPVWNSVFPGFPGQYNGYLSCTNCPNPIFTPDANAPPEILYQVCGGLPASPCIASGVGCDTVTIHVIDDISVTFNVDPGAFCQGNVPDILATVTPPGVYTLSWYNAYDGSNGTGSIIETGYAFTPPGPGQYSLEVNGMDGDIPCSQYIYNFVVAPDDVPPIVTAPPDLTLECNDPTNTQQIQDWLSLATATDDHTQNLSISNNYSGINQTCGASVVVTFTATDECNNTGSDNATIFIFDTQAPNWITTAGAIDRTVECSDATALAAAQALAPTASDLCDPSTLTIQKTTGTFVAGSCPQAGTYTNTWIAKDLCDNVSAVYTQVITITDMTAPVWTTAPGSLNRNVDCDDFAALAAAQALLPVATDNCDGTLTPVKTAGDLVPGSCASAGTYTNTFVVTDDCGNTSNVFTQVITVYDPNPPVLDRPAEDLSVECNGSGNATELNDWLNNHGGAVATDACGPVTWTPNFTALSDLCGATGSATVIFTATDGCFNSITTSATFTITDTQAPVITCPANVIGQIDPLTCESTTVVLGTATATDACSGVGEITITNNAPAAFPPGVTLVTWTATDACGNSSTCTQTVTVEDLIPPTVECPVDVSVNADPGVCLANVTVPAPVVTDPCPYTMSNDYTGTANANGTYPVGTTIVTWTITGISGNVTTCVQEVTVIDNQAPTITCPGNQLFTAPPPDCELVVSAIPDPDLSDNCDKDDLILTWELTGATTGTGTGPVNGTTFNVGVTTVTYTVTDLAGNFATCSFTVTINDDVPPTFITCPGDITVSNDPGECFANVTVPEPVVDDPCGEIVSVTNDFNNTGNASGQYPTGTTVVIWTITDESGNITTCTQNIRVNDTQLPTITCPADVTAIAVPPLCEVPAIVVGNPVYGDNCPGTILTWTKTGATTGAGSGLVNNTTFNVGVTTVTYTVTDAAGNFATCSFTVTINDDVPPTFITCPGDITVSNDPGECFANVTIPEPVVDDPCGEIVSITNDFNNTGNASGQYPTGTTVVIWTITDESGNTTSCTQDITVIDVEFPVITCPANVVAVATPPDCVVPDIVLGLPVYSDNCSGFNVSWTMTGSTTGSGNGTISIYDFNVGTTTMTYTITDAVGNAASCSFTITVNDQVPPTVINCPADVSVNAASGLCEATIAVPAPVVSDPCLQIVTISHDSPYGITSSDASGTYPVGVYNITWTFTDESGNESYCYQEIEIIDDQDPVFIFCPPDVLAEATPPLCEVPDINLLPPTYSDNCGIPVLTWVATGSTPGSGTGFVNITTFNVGTTVITYTITDASGNEATCIFNVVVNDDVPPTVVTCPPNVTVDADAGLCETYVTVPAPGVYDPCGEIVSISHNSAFGISPEDASGTYPVGIHNITWTFTDESGNTSTCPQTITVIDDQLPVIDCPDDVTAIAEPPLCEVPAIVVDDPVYSDNCPNPLLTWTKTGATTGSGTGLVTNTTFNVGVTTVTYTVTDASGNTASCSFTVTVNDQVPPTVITCPPNVTRSAPADSCEVTITVPAPIVDDPCQEIVTVTHDSPHGISGTNASGTYPVGVYNITWTFTDESGNITTCPQVITILDVTDPELVCPPDFEVEADFELPYATDVPIPAPTYSDACGVETLTWVLSGSTNAASPLTGINVISLYTLNVGLNIITYTATDVNGNVSTCQFEIFVNSEPVIECPDDISVFNDPGLCSAVLDPGMPTLISGISPTWTWTMTGATTASGTGRPITPIPFTFNVGITTIMWRAENISGFDECVQTITVTDIESPTFILPSIADGYCVEGFIEAVYNPGGTYYVDDLTPERRDYHILTSGNTVLDLINVSDNCPGTITISWTIDFGINSTIDLSGNGQISASTPINFPLGDNLITWTVTDASGNIETGSTIFRVLPRPEILD